VKITSFKTNSKIARRELGRALTAVENDLDNSDVVINETFNSATKSKIFGITGAPGVGKSTLIDQLIKTFLDGGLTVAVLAIDPSSPFTGGALLGDRTRMYSSGLHNNLFIRSSSSRGHLGGISSKTPEMIKVIEAFDFDIIIVETVGVGQAELDIMKCAHFTSVVLSPNMGDSLQALKAGLIEIADLFVLNKADIAGINQLEKDILFALSLGQSTLKKPKILKTSSTNQTGVLELKKVLLEEYEVLNASGEMDRRIKDSLNFQLELGLRENLKRIFNKFDSLSKKRSSIEEEMYKYKLSPRAAANKLFKDLEKNL